MHRYNKCRLNIISPLQILMSVLLILITVVSILFVSIHVAVFSASVKQDLSELEVVVEVSMIV